MALIEDPRQKPGSTLGVTNSQLETRVKTLETWKATAETRIKALESKPAGTDSSTQITALTARMNAIEAKTCPNQADIDALKADHIPTP